VCALQRSRCCLDDVLRGWNGRELCNTCARPLECRGEWRVHSPFALRKSSGVYPLEAHSMGSAGMALMCQRQASIGGHCYTWGSYSCTLYICAYNCICAQLHTLWCTVVLQLYICWGGVRRRHRVVGSGGLRLERVGMRWHGACGVVGLVRHVCPV